MKRKLASTRPRGHRGPAAEVMHVKQETHFHLSDPRDGLTSRRGGVILRRFNSQQPVGLCLQRLIILYLCVSWHIGVAQSTRMQPRASVEGPSQTYLSATPSSDATSASSLDRQYALGSWGGIRSNLGRRGIVPTALLISDPFGNVHGGEQTGASAYNLFGVDIRVDTTPLLGWKGGQFDVGGAVNWGTSLSRSYIGNGFQVQLADCAGSQPRLTYLSFTQSLLGDRISARIGRLTLNSVFGEEFMGSEYFKSFTSIGFDLVPEGLFFDASGAAGYPRTSWGTRIRYSSGRRLYAQAGAYNADSDQLNGSHHGIDFSLRGPLFAIGEVGYRHFTDDDSARPSSNIKGGGFYTGGTQHAASNGVLKPVHGLYGFYVLGDQQLWRFKVPSGSPKAISEISRWGDAEHERHVGVVASAVVVPEPRTNIMPYFFNVGIVSYGPSPQRPRDSFGVGLVYGSYSRGPIPSGPQSNNGQIPFQVPSNEQTLEVNYGFAVRPGVVFQPTLEYILHPKGISSIPSRLSPGSAVPNALAVGVNTVINF